MDKARIPRVSRALVLGAVLLSISSLAFAGSVSETFFRIDVDNGVESASFEVASDSPFVNYDPGTDTWSWNSAGQFIDLGNVASLDQANLMVIGDPQISMGFALTAGALDTTVTITSAVLSFTPFGNASGVASTAMTVTDNNANGAQLTGIGGSGSAYLATYNTPPGTLFSELIGAITVGPGSSGSANQNTGGFVPISGTVSNMVAQYTFVISAGDQASGTSNFVIVPEPASMAMLVVAGLVLCRRR